MKQNFADFDLQRVPSPCFVVDEVRVRENCEILNELEKKSGGKVLLALKAFSMFACAPIIRKYLSGVCASGLHEARLGYDEFAKKNTEFEVHCYSPAYKPTEFNEILKYSNHIVFNSLSQWQKFKDKAKKFPYKHFGLRINPEHSEGSVALYDPCAPGSRMGVPISQLKKFNHECLSGIHFHTLCEQNFAPLSRTLDVIEEKLGELLKKLKWINLGGGHHITSPDYERSELILRIRKISEKYGLKVYLEPGEAVAINAGILVAEVLDTVDNDGKIAILDSSITCHMPDVLEMPYQPSIIGAKSLGDNLGFSSHLYRVGGASCLAGDQLGYYAFPAPLADGERIAFEDMAIYSMVKTSTFNGVNLPSIALWNSETDELRIVKQFAYQSFRERLS